MALHPCSGVLLEVGPDFWNVCGRWEKGWPPVGLCVRWGREGARGPMEQGPGTRSPAPPRPQVPGVQEPSSGVWGYMQRSVLPPMGWIQLERK